MTPLTVILPAAGKGTRLNLPYPKEILRLDKEQALIDYCFDFFRDYGRKDVQFVVVINEDKTGIVEYLAKYKERFNISFTYQNPFEFEYTGAIKSAKHMFGEHNVILLPDTIMKLPPNTDLIVAIENCLVETGFAFFYKRENNEDMLRTKGCIALNEKGLVTLYEDKPERNLDRFNAFWCSFAFRKRAFDSAIAFMEKSTLRQRVGVDEIKETPIFESKGIEVLDYVDLGTWEEIRKLIANHE